MNILYIGPYRHNNNIGIQSLNYLCYLSEHDCNLISRPIFNESSINNNIHIDLIKPIENKQYSNIDVLIQHTDIKTFVLNTKIKKNIFIPIISNLWPNKNDQLKYKTIGKISEMICSSPVHNYLFKNMDIDHKTVSNTIHKKLKNQQTKQINFEAYNYFKKYYTILTSHDSCDIGQLIFDFIRLFYQKNYCLFIFIENISQKQLEKYNTLISSLYKSMEINFGMHKIVIVPFTPSIETINNIHHTGDVYVSNEYSIQMEFALLHKNKIIYNNSDLNISWDANNPNKYGLIKQEKNIDLEIENEESITYDNSTSILDIIKNVL
jgi:hypothetical protein